MKVVRIVLGIFGILVVLFAGGCALIFLPMAAKPDGWLVIALFSGVPALIGALIATWAFRRRNP